MGSMPRHQNALVLRTYESRERASLARRREISLLAQVRRIPTAGKGPIAGDFLEVYLASKLVGNQSINHPFP